MEEPNKADTEEAAVVEAVEELGGDTPFSWHATFATSFTLATHWKTVASTTIWMQSRRSQTR